MNWEDTESETDEKEAFGTKVDATNVEDSSKKADNSEKKEDPTVQEAVVVPEVDNSYLQSQAFKKVKKKTIFTKNMHLKLPNLKWLPGEAVQIFANADNSKHFERFAAESKRFRIVSLMIYVQQDSSIHLHYLTVSTPLLTLIFNINEEITNNRRFVLPDKVFDVLSDPTITVVVPGRQDWHKSQQFDCLLHLRSFVSPMPTLPKLIKLVDYLEQLAIQPSCVGLPDHMKLIHWIFQIRFNSQLYGDVLPMYLSAQWIQMAHHYGALLIFLFLALQEKKKEIAKNPQSGVNVAPIYLENLLIENRFVEDLPSSELRQKLIGTGKYPDPPLPGLPVSTKK